MQLSDVLSAIRARWWLPVIGLIVGSLSAVLIALAMTPLYSSETQLFISTRESGSTADVFQGSQFSQQRASSYAQLLEGEELAGRVVDRLELSMTPKLLSERVTATPVPETVLIEVSVADPSPQAAQRIAEALGREFSQFITELETPEGAEASPVKVTITDTPDVPLKMSSPQGPRMVALGALVGLVVGAGTAVARSQLDRSVTEPEDAADLAGAAVVGTVLRDDSLEKSHIAPRTGAGRTAEDYRQLRINLQFLNVDQPPKVIMVSSAVPSEGKTTLVVNLALALADAGNRVTVVEADLRKPKVTRYMGLVGGVGLTNILAGTAEVHEVAQPYGSGELLVIAAGLTPPNPGDLLSSSHMASLIDKLRSENDYVLVDAPPLLPVADATGLAAMMDGVLLSVRYGVTTKDQLRQAAETLDRVGAVKLGVILNIVPSKASIVYGYGYGYGDD